jgi:hypothetical protein
MNYYYVAKVAFETIDDRTGRTKKSYEQYLVEADSISDVEDKIKEKFKDALSDFSVVSVQESKIMGIIK